MVAVLIAIPLLSAVVPGVQERGSNDWLWTNEDAEQAEQAEEAEEAEQAEKAEEAEEAETAGNSLAAAAMRSQRVEHAAKDTPKPRGSEF